VWETQEVNLLCGHSALYSATWPASGSMRSGRSSALRRSALHTSESGSSSSPGQLLPTPTTSEARGPGDPEGNRNDTLRARIANLPTPRARDWKSGGKDGLHNEVRLLKTPTAQLAVNGGSQHPDKRKAGGHGPTLADEVEFLMPGGAGKARLLPTPKASDVDRGDCPSERARHSPMLKSVVALLPTPTATPYGNNQSDSPGAAVRPSLDTLAPTLLPTPRATDGTKGGPNQRGSKGDLMLPSAVAQISTGATTSLRCDAGNTSSDALHPAQLTIADA